MKLARFDDYKLLVETLSNLSTSKIDQKSKFNINLNIEIANTVFLEKSN